MASWCFRAIVLSVLVVVSVSAGPAPSVGSSEAWERFRRVNWVTTQSLGSIAPPVLEVLRGRFAGDTRLADRGQPFQATDSVSGHPTRRLVLAGHAGSDSFVVYEQGGRGHHLVFVMFDSREQSPRPVLRATGSAGMHDDVKNWQLKLSELKSALEQGRMSWADPNASQY